MNIIVKRGLILVALFFGWLLLDTIFSAILGRQVGGFVSLLVAGYFAYSCWQAWKPKPVTATPTPPVVVAPVPEPPVDPDPSAR
jgi:hypothetical protein